MLYTFLDYYHRQPENVVNRDAHQKWLLSFQGKPSRNKASHQTHGHSDDFEIRRLLWMRAKGMADRPVAGMCLAKAPNEKNPRVVFTRGGSKILRPLDYFTCNHKPGQQLLHRNRKRRSHRSACHPCCQSSKTCP
jgi:hypothetical protein